MVRTSLCCALLVASGCDVVFQLHSQDAPAENESDALIDVAPRIWLKMDDAPGNTLIESAEQRSAMCVNGCPVSTMGNIDGAVRFGGNQIVDVDAAGLGTSGFTVAAWVFLDQVLPSEHCVMGKPLGDSFANSYIICIQPIGIIEYTTHDSSGMIDVVLSSRAMQQSQWHHLAMTWDAVNGKVGFLDGLAFAGGFVEVGFDDRDIVVGGDRNSGVQTNEFIGRLDDVRVYDVALLPSQVSALAGR